MKRCIVLVILTLSCFSVIYAQMEDQLPSTEEDYYKIATLPIPEGIILEVGGIATLPNGDIAAATRRGDVWVIENPYSENQTVPHYRKFAEGLHEPLGLSFHDGTLYAVQRGELTRLWDKNGDGYADYYETVYAWPLSGNYHEYSYGPKVMPNGDFVVTANVGFFSPEWWSGKSRVPWRGWTLKISPDGELNPYATGMRSPCAIGIIDGELFYGDNQGDWIGSGGIVHLNEGDFAGHPAGLSWSSHPASPVKVKRDELYATIDPKITPAGQAPIKPENDTTVTIPLFEMEESFPAVKTPAVWLPHAVLGISTSEIVVDDTEGKFGPFSGQIFVGDQGQSKIMRVDMEKVNGVYQGVAFLFREGFESGVLRMCWGNDGSMFVGQTNRGWGSTGPKPFGLQRLVWTGKVPFEMKTIKATPDGFEVEFTQPVNKASASDPESYQVNSFIYKYHPVYGSPAVNMEENFVAGVKVSPDGMKVRLLVDDLRKKYVHEINVTGVRSYYNGSRLLHSTAYYTLNEIPEGAALNIQRRKKVVDTQTPDSSTPSSSSIGTPDDPASRAVAKTATDRKETEVSAKSASQAPNRSATASVKLPKRMAKVPDYWNNKIDKSVILGTVPGLKFDQTEVTVKAGAKVKWTFNNNDDMPHNFVLVSPGKADQVGDEAIKLGVKGISMNYIPNSSSILYHSNLMQPGTSETIYFEAPSTPGEYTYVCTVPGHAQLMRGTLKVVK